MKQHEAWLIQGAVTIVFSSRSAPRDGAYVHGLFMEGARWDIQQGIITESKLKELFPTMPVVNIRVSANTMEILFLLCVFCVVMFISHLIMY
jgi:hypothetical protein